MANENANYYGVLLLILMFVTVLGLLTGEPKTTGFAVKEAQDYSVFDVGAGEQGTCADGSLYGECSSLIKPKFCLNGRLADYCELCGCDSGEVCKDRECVKAE